MMSGIQESRGSERLNMDNEASNNYYQIGKNLLKITCLPKLHTHAYSCNQWRDSAGSHRFYRTVSGNFIITANRLALPLILVLLAETELADNI